MIKKLRVTVDGNTYDVTVELPDDSAAPALSVGPFSAPAPANPPPASLAPAPSAPAPMPAPAAAPESSSSAAGPGDVPSPLAGRVTAVVVSVGQEVKEGDHLITLEAMKMNTFVFAPRAGKVAEVKAAVGSAVQEGESLVRIE
jgi:biotin carboxyl carrier protein